jgi:hypothetical protein
MMVRQMAVNDGLPPYASDILKNDCKTGSPPNVKPDGFLASAESNPKCSLRFYSHCRTINRHPLQMRALRENARRRWTIALQMKKIGSGTAQRQLVIK